MIEKVNAAIKALNICSQDIACVGCPYKGKEDPERGVLCADLMMKDAMFLMRKYRDRLIRDQAFEKSSGAGRKSRPVLMVDSSGNVLQTYANAEAAAQDVGTEANNIRQCCRGKHKMAAGRMWMYGD